VFTVWPDYWRFGVEDGVYGPQIVTCDIPVQYSSQIPEAISIQPINDCNLIGDSPTNVLRVINNRRDVQQLIRPSIGLCVQAFRFRTYDVSVRLVEWLEMVKMMGGDKVYFYVYGAVPSMMQVLQHYQKEVSSAMKVKV